MINLIRDFRNSVRSYVEAPRFADYDGFEPERLSLLADGPVVLVILAPKRKMLPSSHPIGQNFMLNQRQFVM